MAVLGASGMLALALAGCSGDDHSGALSGRGGNGADAGGGSGGLQTADPGTVGMHRLNGAEYNATVADVLGTTLQPASGSWRGGELAGFDNIASVLGVDEAQYERYFEAAGALATEVMASDGLRARFVPCDLTDSACVGSSIAAAGLRILRRPIDSDEQQTYQHVYDSAREVGENESAAFTLVLQTLLSSAEFLYRIELDPDPSSTEPHPIGPFELASRLSYFLWSSAPDDALLEAAGNGSLTKPDVLSTTIDRLLADRNKAERFVTNFAGQWLGARQVLSHAVATSFPHWLPQTAQAASQEILLYFDDFVKSGRSWFEFPTADINFVDGPLAYFYGIPTDDMSVGVYHRVEYPDDKRAGFFGLAGFLAVTSLADRTSPSRRGRWVAGSLLCTELPPPPANIPPLDPADTAGDGTAPPINVRQKLERHRTEPSCVVCHSVFDPYGLALENFDAIGKFRTTYDDGTPVDASVVLPGSSVTVDGADALARAVSADPRLGECLGRKLLTYGLGRTMTVDDEAHLAQAQAEWLQPGETPSVGRLIHALVTTRAFLFRRAETTGSATP